MNWQTQHTQQFLENIGWTLIHSLWQISLIALILFFSLRLLKNASANLRYLFSISALSLTIILPAVTFLHSSPSSATKRETISINLDKSAASSVEPVVNKDSKSLNIPINAAKDNPVNETPLNLTFENIQDKAETLLKNSLPYFVWFWLFGILFFSFRLCGGIWQNHRLKTFKVSVVDINWQEKFDELCAGIGISRTVKLIQSNFAQSPMVIGWLKPFVIIPSSVLLGLNPRELETIIVHELIHIRRHDYLINIFQSFVEIVLFFHPLLWWISAQVRRERENACDDEVLKFFEGESLTYAQALANLEDLRSQTNFLTPSNILAANGGNLMLRIQRIIRRNTAERNPKYSVWSTIPVVLLIAIVLLAVFSTNWQTATSNASNLKNNSNMKKIAIGLYSESDVIPSEKSREDDEKTMQLVIAKLKQNNIPTTGFVKGVTVNANSPESLLKQENIVHLWREAGFEIGMWDLKYPQSFNASINDYKAAAKNKYNKISWDLVQKERQQFKEEIQKLKTSNKSKLEKLEDLKKVGELLRKSPEQLLVAEKEWLKENNLTSVKYTIGSHDWIYSYTYDVARQKNDKQLMNQIKIEFIVYISKMFEHYEEYSQQIFGRDIPQIMPLTPSQLIVDSSDELFAMLQKREYKFVSIDDAMQDEAFQSNRIFANGVGSSWFQSVSLEKGKTFLNKPNVDADILKLWEENQPRN